MTICIAAFCDHGSSLLLCTDQMITMSDLGASDKAALKIRSVHANWAVMYSARDITAVKPILTNMRSKIPDRKTPLSLEVLNEITQEAFRGELHRNQEGGFLASHRLTLDEFHLKGREIFGDSLFTESCSRLEKVELGCQLLVAGFDSNLGGHLFTVTDPGKATNYDDVGFWAIGSGDNRALASLMFHGFNIKRPLSEGIYHVLEAKFMSEGQEIGVGTETSLLVCRREAIREEAAERIVVREISQQAIQELRELWEKDGKPRLPSTANSVVNEAFSKANEMFFG